jgi:hypothetical protein
MCYDFVMSGMYIVSDNSNFESAKGVKVQMMSELSRDHGTWS